jgi:hypothetical protein
MSPDTSDDEILMSEERGGEPDKIAKVNLDDNHPKDKERISIIKQHVDKLIKKGKSRQDSFLPYLLVRCKPGDHGIRNPRPSNCWGSPDIIIVQGDTNDPTGGTDTITYNVPHSIFVHVWNLGRLDAIGVKLSVYWADPGYFGNPMTGEVSTQDDPVYRHYIGGMYLNLPDRNQPGCHRIFKIPQLWTPLIGDYTYLEGPSVLLAKVECITDVAKPGIFDASSDRHVGHKKIVADL